MTTWDNSAVSKVYTSYPAPLLEKTFMVTGASGDTGGTLTATGIKKIVSAVVTPIHSAALANLTWRVASNTVVVGYDDPTAAHELSVTVKGIKG